MADKWPQVLRLELFAPSIQLPGKGSSLDKHGLSTALSIHPEKGQENGHQIT